MSAARTETASKEAFANSQANRRYFIPSLGAMIMPHFFFPFLLYVQESSAGIFWSSDPPNKIAYDFQFTNQDGAVTRLSQWRGKVVLFSFGFTHCPNV